MAACSVCDYENVVGANFCSSCGTQLQKAERVDDVTAAYEPIPLDIEEVPDVTDLPEGSVAAFVVYSGPKKGTRIALGTEELTIGRDPSCDVFLDDVTVSRSHAKVSPNGEEFEVIDLGSMNGTYVNKSLTERTFLKDRDELQIGKFKLVFLKVQDTEEAP